jgi:hypothetical protein
MAPIIEALAKYSENPDPKAAGREILDKMSSNATFCKDVIKMCSMMKKETHSEKAMQQRDQVMHLIHAESKNNSSLEKNVKAAIDRPAPPAMIFSNMSGKTSPPKNELKEDKEASKDAVLSSPRSPRRT